MLRPPARNDAARRAGRRIGRRGVRAARGRGPRGHLSRAARRRRPYLGIHKYDDKLEDYSRQGVDGSGGRAEAVQGAASRRSIPRRCHADRQLDREQVLHAMDSRLPAARRREAVGEGSGHLQQRPHEHRLHHGEAQLRARSSERLELLIEREKAMPAALAEARKNLENPPKIYVADRDRPARRQPRVLQDRGDRGLQGREGPGAAGGVQEGERRGDRGARRLQDLAAEGSAPAREGRVRVSAPRRTGRSCWPTR